MGGNALKNTITRRYEKQEFDNLALKIIPKIEKLFLTKASLVKSFHSKETFGDMDILLLVPMDYEGHKRISQCKELIQSSFQPNQIVKNGSCISFDVEQLQIDLILIPHKNWQIAQVFYSYNDLGNLMGKIFHKFGLKYGFDGLKYIHRQDSKIIYKITVSKDPFQIFKFIGLDFFDTINGFDTIEDVFDYIISSKYFSKEIFAFENLNSINKRRNKRRPNFNAFLEYVKDSEKTFEFNPDKKAYLPMIDAFFPESKLLEKIKLGNEKLAETNSLKKLFNGKLVMERYPDLRGKELGETIGKFISSVDNDFMEYLKLMSEQYGTCATDRIFEKFDEIIKQ